MSENYDLNALFHPKVDIGDQTPKNLVEYGPTADKGKNGVYQSVVRFVAWWQDPQHSIFDKWVSWLVDPVTNRGRFVDCPSSIGKPSILQDMFFKLWKSESIQERQKAAIFSRKHSFATIVQIIKDDQNPDLVGKLMVWKFGKKIFEKIEAEKKPLVGEPHEPFDLLYGKAFQVVITKVAGFNNYDQSKFLEVKIPLLITGKDGKMFKINENTPKQDVFNFLKENSPDLNKYAFKEWDQETHDYVNQVITQVTGQTPSSAYADVRNAKQTSTPTASTNVSAPKSGITSTDLNLEDLNTAMPGIADLDLPDLPSSNDFGIGGDLEDALNNI